ncbi:MAG: pyruvate kinase [Atribacterota bacterium]|nr:pyruvate kinase [Atribacterota bacterium]MDD5638217.1 pyruvate kinase [Atribacterota bacterium]
MKFPTSKTKIVCTLGPASNNKKIIRQLVLAGMDVARLNLAHDTLDVHRKTLRYIREVEKELEISIPVMMDIPGPKIRLGKIKNGPITLKRGQIIKLTTSNKVGNDSLLPVEYKDLIQSVKIGSLIYLYDGFIQLRVTDISQEKEEVTCKVLIGGKLDSHKGLNLPKAKILLEAISEQDLRLINFGLEEGVNIFGISFVEKADDIIKVKEFAQKKGKKIFTVAKIEREEAVKNIDKILKVTDAIMVARGDLGVQVDIEEIPIIQKKLIAKANKMSKPVITATQMLVSMTDHIRPTRSEVTDVANAILDGTDATMLSEETAVGQFPVEAVKMMTNIAVSTEREYRSFQYHSSLCEDLRLSFQQKKPSIEDIISMHTMESSQIIRSKYILTPTESGNTARRISRFKPFCWILAFTPNQEVARFLALSYGVVPFMIDSKKTDWYRRIMDLLKEKKLVKQDDYLILTEGTIKKMTGGTDSMRIISVD